MPVYSYMGDIWTVTNIDICLIVNISLVCHANVIRYLLCKLMQVRENAWLQMTLYHGSVTKVVMKGNGDLRVMAVGSAGFVPPELMTYSNGRLEKLATASSEKVPEK